MEKKTYSELLSDPRWQKKRLEVMERDNFTCQHCGCTDRKLNIHHKYYMDKHNPWDYPLNAFITLCDKCHHNEHNDEEIPYLLFELNKLGFTYKMIEDILRGILVKLVHLDLPISDIQQYFVGDKPYSLENNISVIDYIKGAINEYEE